MTTLNISVQSSPPTPPPPSFIPENASRSIWGFLKRIPQHNWGYRRRGSQFVALTAYKGWGWESCGGKCVPITRFFLLRFLVEPVRWADPLIADQCIARRKSRNVDRAKCAMESNEEDDRKEVQNVVHYFASFQTQEMNRILFELPIRSFSLRYLFPPPVVHNHKELIFTAFKRSYFPQHIQLLCLHLHFVYMSELHVHGVDRGEDWCVALDNTFTRFGHRYGCTGGQENGLIAATKWETTDEVTLH